MGVVLDASALLAYLHEEPGGERVAQVLDGSLVSAVNWAEVVKKSLERGVTVEGMQLEFAAVGVRFEPFTPQQAEIAACLAVPTRPQGLSLADRACLALAASKGLPAMTADRAWSGLSIDVEIDVIR